MKTKLQELLVPFMLAIVTVLALQYYWGTGQPQVDVSGRRVEVPLPHQQRYEHPNLEIDFYDNEVKNKEELTSFETKDAQYVFTNHGAALQRISFQHATDGKAGYLTVLEPLPAHEREARSYLVALNRQTPYYYTLQKHDEDDTAHYLNYQADFGDGTLEKKFTVYKDTSKIDLQVTVQPKPDVEPVRLRVFFNTPYIKALADKDQLAAFVEESGKIKKYSDPVSATGPYWDVPTIQGLQDRYFVDAFVADPNGFVQRGYFKSTALPGGSRLQGILESKPVTESTSWTISFYFGPKTSDAMMAVDPRLDQVIDYGFFATISRPVSKLLLAVLNFLYDHVHNYGIAIIILTLLMRLLMVPFTYKAEGARKKQEEFAKRMKYIQQRYKDDQEGLAQARMELVRKHGVMPGAGGCIPLLFQLPLFWGLSVVLSNSIALYGAPFLWISDLSSRDPYYILPILAGMGIMLATPSGKDPKQRFVGIAMGLFFMALSVNFSAGLSLYIAVSMLFAAAQMTIIRGMKR